MNTWVSEGRLTAGGKSLHYACTGPHPDEAPTLILLHEGLGSVGLWRDFPVRLAAATGFGVMAYSRAGYGRSDPAALPRPLDYMTREAVEVLPQVLDHIGVQRGILLGHSDGATIAAIHAGTMADMRIGGVITMAPHFFTEPMGLAAIARAKDAFDAGDLRARLARHHDDPDNAFRGWNDAWLDPAFEAWNVAEVLSGIRVPVLAIQGIADEYGTLAQIEEIEKHCLAPVEVLVLEDCRHAPFLDQPDAVLCVVTRFCQHVRASVAR